MFYSNTQIYIRTVWPIDNPAGDIVTDSAVVLMEYPYMLAGIIIYAIPRVSRTASTA